MSTPQQKESTGLQKVEVRKFGQLLIRHDEAGQLDLVVKPVTLTAGQHYVRIGKKGQMTAAGIDEKNRPAGCSVLNPPVVVVDGVEQGNPFVETDSVQGVVRVLARKLIIGRNPFGEWVAIDYTADFIPEAYHRRDLLQVVSDTPEAGWLGGPEHGPDEDQKKRGRWRFVPTHGNDVGLWIDLAHAEIQKVYETTDQRRLHALKTAQTIARRNGLAMHPAIGGQRFKLDSVEDEFKWGKKKGQKFMRYILPETKADEVYCYVSRGTRRDVEDLAANVAANRSLDIRPEQVAVETPDDSEVVDAVFQQADSQAEAERMEEKAPVAPESETGEENVEPDGRPTPPPSDKPEADEFEGWDE